MLAEIVPGEARAHAPALLVPRTHFALHNHSIKPSPMLNVPTGVQSRNKGFR